MLTASWVPAPLAARIVLHTAYDDLGDPLVAGDKIRDGFRVTFANGTIRRFGFYYEFGGTPEARCEDDAGVEKGDGGAIPAEPSSALFRLDLREDGLTQWMVFTASYPTWQIVNSEPIHPVITKFEIKCSRAGTGTFEWEFRHDYIRRWFAVAQYGSTSDISYVPGISSDSTFLDLINRVKPSGLTIVVQE